MKIIQDLIDELIIIRSATHTQKDYSSLTIAIEKAKEYLPYTESEHEPTSLNEDAELERLNNKYPIKDMNDYNRITLIWENAAWEIQEVWKLYYNEVITQSKARELTRSIIDSHAQSNVSPAEK